jgi:hypothetical protein
MQKGVATNPMVAGATKKRGSPRVKVGTPPHIPPPLAPAAPRFSRLRRSIWPPQTQLLDPPLAAPEY